MLVPRIEPGISFAGYRRAIRFILPYWPRLILILLAGAIATAFGLAQPYISKLLIDDALLKRDLRMLVIVSGLMILVTVLGFGLNIFSSYQYVRVSALVLFDMRLALYRHLQQLSPRFYARTPLGDILARVNNDVGEIQRVAAESLLAWAGNALFLAGSVGAMFWLDPRLALVGVALVPASVWALRRVRGQLAQRVKTVREASAGVGTFLIDTLQAVRLVVTSNAQQREADRFRRHNAAFIDALMAMQWWSYLSGSVPGLILSLGYAAVFVYGGHRVVDGTLSVTTIAEATRSPDAGSHLPRLLTEVV